MSEPMTVRPSVRPIPGWGVAAVGRGRWLWFASRSQTAAARRDFLERGLADSEAEAVAMAQAAALPGSERVSEYVAGEIEIAFRLGQLREEDRDAR